MSARFLRHDAAQTPASLAISIGVIGKPVESSTLSSGEGAAIPTGDDFWPYADPVQDLSTAIHEAGDDIVLRIAMPPCWDVTCAVATAVLVDDLRIE